MLGKTCEVEDPIEKPMPPSVLIELEVEAFYKGGNLLVSSSKYIGSD